jgi:hypothetical protein
MNEMTTLEHTRTNVAARPMAKAVWSELLVARVGHRPKSRTKMGLEPTIPLVSSSSATSSSVVLGSGTGG